MKKNIANHLITLIFCSPLLLSLSSHAKVKKTIDYCENNSQTAEQLSICLDQVRDLALKELTTWQNNQVFILTEIEQKTGRGAALRMFQRAKKDFEKFRENNCRWQYLQISPAKGAATAYKKCYIRLTQAHINELVMLN